MRVKNTSSKDNAIVLEDLLYIYNNLSEKEKEKLRNSTILITGCGGFLGYYFMQFFSFFGKKLNVKKVVGLENFITEKKDWLLDLKESSDIVSIYTFDIIKDNLNEIEEIDEIDFVIHAASIASPTFYRKYPLQTIDANIVGLRRLFDQCLKKAIKGFLFLSSSEIYGDPTPNEIPTKESYTGNVSSIGPRACYDESKRLGETLCYIFAHQHSLPITIARPFNNYGPGMSPNDKRLPADFANSVIKNKDLIIYSDGKPKRTFCYVADSITGYIKCLLYGKFEVFNIGIDENEVSVKTFAQEFMKQAKEVFDYTGQIKYRISDDNQYLTDNPNRRCPDITKARTKLNYQPKIQVAEGVSRYLNFLKNGKL